MKAVILVGGEGTRMRPLTLHTPKPLLPVANVAFIERQIRWLAQYDVTEVVLSLGYLPNAFEEYFHENPFDGVSITYAVEDSPLGTAGAIRFAAGQTDDNIIVCNGDVLTDLDLSHLIDFHTSRDALATIALTYVEDPSAFGVVPTKPDGEVVAFVEKPPRENAPSHWINAGMYVLTPEFLSLIPENLNVSIERETFPLALQQGKMFALESDAYWLDIGMPHQYLQAHSDYLANPSRFSGSDDLREIQPGLYANGEVTVGDNVVLEAPSLLGAGCVVGDNVILNAACLGHRCVVESGVTLRNCVIMSGVQIDEDAVIDSSIVGPYCHIGVQSRVEEYTLVGAHEKVGPQSHLQSERVGAVV